MEAEALQAFFSHVNSLGILPVYWPNVKKDPATTEHLRVSVLPVTPETLTVCSGASKYQWILQVAVYVRDGVGAISPAQHVDSLRAGIPFNTRLIRSGYQFQTISTGVVSPPVQSDGWFFVPVQFRFICIK